MRNEYKGWIGLAGAAPGSDAPSKAFPKESCCRRRNFQNEQPSVHTVGVWIVWGVSHYVEMRVSGQCRNLSDAELFQHLSAISVRRGSLRAGLGVADDPTVLDVPVQHILEGPGDVFCLT